MVDEFAPPMKPTTSPEVSMAVAAQPRALGDGGFGLQGSGEEVYGVMTSVGVLDSPSHSTARDTFFT